MGTNKNTHFTVDGSDTAHHVARAITDLQRSASLPGDRYADLDMDTYGEIVRDGLKALDRHFETLETFTIEENIKGKSPRKVEPETYEPDHWLLHFDASNLRRGTSEALNCRVTFKPNSTQAEFSGDHVIYVDAKVGQRLFYNGHLSLFDPISVGKREQLCTIANMTTEHGLGVTEVVDYLAVNSEFKETFGDQCKSLWSGYRNRTYETIRGNVSNVKETLANSTTTAGKQTPRSSRSAQPLITEESLAAITDGVQNLRETVAENGTVAETLSLQGGDLRLRVELDQAENPFVYLLFSGALMEGVVESDRMAVPRQPVNISKRLVDHLQTTLATADEETRELAFNSMNPASASKVFEMDDAVPQIAFEGNPVQLKNTDATHPGQVNAREE